MFPLVNTGRPSFPFFGPHRGATRSCRSRAQIQIKFQSPTMMPVFTRKPGPFFLVQPAMTGNGFPMAPMEIMERVMTGEWFMAQVSNHNYPEWLLFLGVFFLKLWSVTIGSFRDGLFGMVTLWYVTNRYWKRTNLMHLSHSWFSFERWWFSILC